MARTALQHPHPDQATTLPVIDLAPFSSSDTTRSEAVVQSISEACESTGFFYVANHGVPQSIIDRTFAEAARFHALPLERKLEIKIRRIISNHTLQRTHQVRIWVIFTSNGIPSKLDGTILDGDQ